MVPVMHLLKMIIFSKHSRAVLKTACAAVLVINVYLLIQFFSWDNTVHLRKTQEITTVVRPKAAHPFLHLLPSQSQLTSVKKCMQPKLSLLHDTLSFAFYPMQPLNCSGSNLFYLNNGFLNVNNTIKNKLKMCEVFAIKRESDNYSFLEKLTETSGNNSVKINEDFIYLRCHYKNDNEIDTEQNGKKNVQYSSSTVKNNILSASNGIKMGPLLFDKANSTFSSFIENRISSISDKKRLQYAKYKSNLIEDNAFSNIYRVRRDVDTNIIISHLNNEDIQAEENYSKRNEVTDSHSGTEGMAEIKKSYFVKNGPSVSVYRKIEDNENNSRFSKEVGKRMQKTSQKAITNTTVKFLEDTTKEQQNVSDLSVSQSKIKSKGKSIIKFENGEKTLPTDIDEEEYLEFGYNDPDESEQNEMDENYDRFYRLHEEFNDNRERENYPEQLDGEYVRLPACGEEQILVQVSPLKHVFGRHKITSEKTSGLNVLMFGIDSMSNMAFRRKLPLTYNFLQTELEAVIFDGYNIVGDGTTQALLPMFLGKLQHEIPDILDTHLDELDFVWKHYQRQGYVTMFAEDEPGLGVFNLRLRGFQDQPTDHYMRYFWQTQASSHLKTECSSQYCTGSTPNHQYLLHYLQDFFRNYHGIPHFAVGYSGELSHNEVNPSEYLDKDLQKFLASLKLDGYLKNTVVIIFADHGSRKGKLRRLLQGKLEERLPFLSMIFPKSFRKTHRSLFENLRINTHRLTTPFDIHETLLDLLDLSKAYSSDKPETKRSISLLRPIPENRTCSQAGIDTHWCTCVHEKPVPTSDPVVKRAAQAVISAINNLTKSDRSQCAVLKLSAIHPASMVIPNLQVLKFHKTEETSNFTVSYGIATLDMVEFQVTIETDKCKGVFETTVQAHYHQDDTLTADGNVDMARLTFNVFEQDISRINTYGSQSACISKSNPRIMKFCCCLKNVGKDKLNSR